MSALAYRFAVWIFAVLFVFGVLNVKGDIAPDITVISYPDDNLVYADPMEYQRTKRSDIHDGDTGVSDDDDDEIGDEGFDEEDEDDEDSSESLTNSPGGSTSSVVHKKDEIHQMNEKPVQQQQPASIDDDYDDDDEESSSDEAGSSAGSSDNSEGIAGESGSAEVRSQSSYARQHISDNEEDANDDASADKDEIDGSSDIDGGQKKRIDSEEKKPTVSVRRSKPRNLIKMVLEESKHAEQKEKLERENDEENSGQESGSSASFVQDSGVKEFFHGEDTAKENETEPLHNETHLHPKLLNNSSNEKSVTIKSKAKPEVKKNDTKSKLQKDTTPHEEKAKDEVRPKPQVQQLHQVEQLHHVEQLHRVHKPEHVRKKSVKKASIGVSKVSHLAKKRLHNKYMTAHVTHAHVTKSHPRIVHKKPVNKGSSQMCHSDRILAGHSLKGGTRAGHFDSLGETASMHACLQRCCSKHTCDVALLVDGSCFGVACYSKELCEPIPVPHPHFVFSQLGFISKGQKRGDIEKNQEFHCKYGNLTLRNNEQWSGELCGGVVTCKDGIATVKKCPGIPPKPDDCAKPRLVVKHRNGECCQMKWNCKARHCTFNNRLIKHGYTLSDPLCTGVVSCYNGQLHMDYCPKIPEKPKDCARPKLKTISVPGKCCKKLWVCSDKSCKYDGLKLSHGEKLTDASCAVVMECRNGFLHDKQCPGPPPVPHICINPSLKVKRIPGECCEMNWTCDIS